MSVFKDEFYMPFLNIEFTTILIYLCSPELDFRMPEYIFFTQATMNSYLNMDLGKKLDQIFTGTKSQFLIIPTLLTVTNK